MARQLERRLEELQLERKRLRAAIQRVGQSFGKTLERGALLEIAVQTAVDGVGAHAGRAALRTESHGRFEEIAGEGDVNRYRDAIAAAEAAALDTGTTVEAEVADAFALSHPLRAQDSGRILGMLSVARAAEQFSAGGARAVRLPRRPGRRLDRERGPARHGQAPGRHRRADRPVQPPPLPGGHRQRGRANQARRPRDGPDHARHRQLQARQRHLRPHAGRSRAARGRAGAAGDVARDRRAGALRRRGDGRRAAGHRPRRRVPASPSASAAASSRSSCR